MTGESLFKRAKSALDRKWGGYRKSNFLQGNQEDGSRTEGGRAQKNAEAAGEMIGRKRKKQCRLRIGGRRG